MKVQYKHKIKLPLDMVSKQVFLYLPDYFKDLLKRAVYCQTADWRFNKS